MKGLVAVVAAVLASTAFVGTAPASVRAKDPVVYQTLPPSKENTFFDITTLYTPQLGQSLTVTRPMTWKTLEMGTTELKLVRDLDTFADLVAGGYDENWFEKHFSEYRVAADVSIDVWRQDAPGPVPQVLDLSQGYTNVLGIKVRKTMTVGARVTFRLGQGVAVTPGRYFITIGLNFVDPRVFNLRFTGQENGTNTLGGYDHSHPVRPECAKYTMTKDAHPGGQAYRSKTESLPGPPLWKAPFTTVFETVKTKVMMPCDMTGIYDPNEQIWNPGDLGLVIRGVRG